MRISRLYLFIPFVVLFVVSCNLSEKKAAQNTSAQVEEIKIDFDANKVLPVSSIIDTCESIKLQTLNDNLIGSISKICFVKQKRLYILDQMSNIISIFDSKGTFISKINRNGMGYGEYKSITDFQVDRNTNTIGIVDAMRGKFLKLDLEGNLIKEYPINSMIGVTKFSFLDNGDIAFSRGIPPDKKDRMYSLIITDKNLNFKGNYLHYENASSAVVSAFYPFQKIGAEILYLPVYNNKIYTVSSTGVTERYKLSFGDKWITDEYAYKPAHTKTYQWVFNELPKSNFVYFVNFSITDHHILVYYSYKNDDYLTVYDKTTKKQVSTKLDKTYRALGFSSENTNTIADNYYVGYVRDLSQINASDQGNLFTFIKNTETESPDVRNPILLLTTLKKIL